MSARILREATKRRRLAAIVIGEGVLPAAFFSPASESILPSLVEQGELAQANAVRVVFERRP